MLVAGQGIAPDFESAGSGSDVCEERCPTGEKHEFECYESTGTISSQNMLIRAPELRREKVNDMSKAISHILQSLVFCICVAMLSSCGWVKETVGKASGKIAAKLQEKAYEDNQDIVPAGPPPALAQYELPPFSFATTDKEPHFAKMTICLGYEKNDALGEELKERNPQICHVIRVLASGKSFDEIKDVAGLVSFADEIKANINMVLVAGKISEVYFKEMTRN